MNCPRCGSETKPGQKFCAECGLALATACPNCGTPYEGSPKFCAECGASLGTQATPDADPVTSHVGAAAHAAVSAERRFVTILFADLVGFTTLSEQQDPEEVRDLLSRYFDVAREVITGYGGTVEKFIGDAVMAVWGAPVAQEDDPERAVRAALELVDRVRGLRIAHHTLQIRAGVLSGEAAVTPGRVGEGMVAGDIVNTASRLQSVAPQGAVLVGESTQRATSGAIAYEPAGDQTLKGKQAPIPAWRALRVVARIGGEGRESALEPPFVGRDEELRNLKDQLHAAERERRLRVVAINGQAGLGKSRLVWELEKYLDGLAGPLLYYLHRGRSPSYGEGVTFWALGEMVRQRARIAEGEDVATTRDKLRLTLDQFVPDPEERHWIEPALGALLGIDEAGSIEREQLFSAWRTFFERIADKGPVVLIFEDLQWADSGLLDFLDDLFDRARDRPMLVITLARPELLDRRPNFGMGRHSFAALHLEPLDDAAIAALLRGLVPALPDADLHRIVARAEGVPLFAVETVRSLVDSGHLVREGDRYSITADLPVLDIPPTLRALIASRLDALDETDRAFLQDASVLGVVFSAAALAVLSGREREDVDSRLRAIMAKEIVTLETDPRSPERGQYRFTQGLIREVAYSTLSKRERRARHVAAARYFEGIGDEELAGVLANHYLEAYNAAPEGDEGAAVAAQARVALRAAAERAARLHSHAQALAYYEQAVAVTFEERDRAELREIAAQSAFAIGEVLTAESLVRAAIETRQSLGDAAGVTRATAQLGQILIQGSRIDEGLQLLSDAIEALPDKTSMEAADIYAQLARAHLFLDKPAQALDAIAPALEIAEAHGARSATLQLLITKGWAMAVSRRPVESNVLTFGALAMADADGDAQAQSRARFNLSGTVGFDDPRLAMRVGEDGMALDEQRGLILRAASFAGNLATMAVVTGDLETAISLESRVERVDSPISLGVHGYVAIAHALRGEFDRAEELMRIVRQGSAGSSSRQDLSTVGYQESMIAFARGDLGEARRLARQTRDAYFGADGPLAAVLAARCSLLSRDLAGAQADRAYLHENRILGKWLDGCVREADAGLLALDGRTAEARSAFREIISEWRSKDLRMDLALCLVEQAVLLGESDKEAVAGRDEAAGLFAAMGADGLMEQIERGLAAAAQSARGVKTKPTTPREGAAATTH